MIIWISEENKVTFRAMVVNYVFLFPGTSFIKNIMVNSCWINITKLVINKVMLNNLQPLFNYYEFCCRKEKRKFSGYALELDYFFSQWINGHYQTSRFS